MPNPVSLPLLPAPTLLAMDALLSRHLSHPFWTPHSAWLFSPDVQTVPCLWGVTLTQWLLCWEMLKAQGMPSHAS